MADVTVVTASIPSRARLLSEASASVAAQTVPVEHLIYTDRERDVGEKRNRLIAAADTEWIAFLDDDDLLDPHHVETLLGGDADVIVPHCRFDGPPLPPPAACWTDGCLGGHNRPSYDSKHMQEEHNLFPITVLARREAVLDVGGFPLGGDEPEDWGLWKRMDAAGATFQIIPEVTWTYRTRGVDRRSPGSPRTKATLRLRVKRQLARRIGR
jgi:hypothetical protein